MARKTRDLSAIPQAEREHYERKLLAGQLSMALAALDPGAVGIEQMARTFAEVNPYDAGYAADFSPKRLRSVAAVLTAWADALEAKQAS